MLITILAIIGLFFVTINVYRKGKRDGIKDAIDYLVTEMKNREIDAERLIVDEHLDKLNKFKKINLLPFLNRRKKNE